MWTQASSLLLLACYLWSAEAQDARRQSIWEEPIKFKTKGNDMCTMIITGQGEYTRLRLSCKGNTRSYWCEYLGTPHTCRSYNKNPHHYFVQMMWGLRKLQNACQAPREIKPHMCRGATNDSKMVFSTASFSRPWPEDSSTAEARQPPQTARTRPPAPTRPDSARQPSTKTVRVPPRVITTQGSSTQPTAPPVESNSKRIARQYCWRSLQGVCSYVIGLFRH